MRALDRVIMVSDRMRRARRYPLLTLLCALLATAVVPSTSRTAYAEVARPPAPSVTRAAEDERPAPSRALDDPRCPPAAADGRGSTILPRPAPPRRSAPFYVLYCSLLC